MRPLGDLTRVENLAFDPTGNTIACSAEVGFNTDVYLVDVASGAARRLTWHPAVDRCFGFSPDGLHVLFRSGRDHPLGHGELFSVPVVGGTPTPMGVGPVSHASADVRSGRIAFCPGTLMDRSWRGYRGGMTQDIWWLDSGGSMQRVEGDVSSEFAPSFGSAGMFYLSDRSGELELYLRAVARDGDRSAASPGGPSIRLTESAATFPPRWPSANAAPHDPRVVFVQGATLCVADPRPIGNGTSDQQVAAPGASVARYEVRIDSSASRTQPMSRPLLNETTAIAISDGADAVTCVARGAAVRLWSGRKEELVPASIGADGAVMISDGRVVIGRLDADGFRLATFDDDGVEEEIFRAPEAPRTFAVSADGTRVALAGMDGKVWVSRVGESAARHVQGVRVGRFGELEWSPDGALLAVTGETSDLVTVLYLYDARSERVEAVGDGLAADVLPSFDPSGHYLLFASSVPTPMGDGRYSIRALPLRIETPPPEPHLLLGAGFDPTEFWRDAGAFVADMGDLQGRVRTLDRVGEVNLAWMEATQGGIAWTETPEDADADADEGSLYAGPSNQLLRWLSFNEEEAITVQDGVSVVSRSPSGDWIAFLMESDGVASIQAWSPEQEAYESYAGAALGARIEIDPWVETRRVLGQAWILLRDAFFNGDMVRAPWEDAFRRHAALADRICTDAERLDLLQQLLRELDASHLEVTLREDKDVPAPGSPEEAWYEGWDALLGAELAVDGDAVRIVRICKPAGPGDSAPVSPLDRPWTGLRAGWKILQVDGVPLSRSTNIYSMLVGRERAEVELTLQKADGSRVRQVVRGIDGSGAQALRYADWRRRTRDRAAALSAGQVGYIHLADLDESALVDFVAQYQGQLGKRGLVLDIRGNAGGYRSAEVLRLLMTRSWGVDLDRYGVVGEMPSDAFHGDLALVTDEQVASDGEYLTILFRQLGLGRVIGARTAGWLSGIEEMQLVDGTELWVPTMTTRSEAIGAYPEGVGVAPDQIARRDPPDYLADRDPPLEAAVSWLLDQPEPVNVSRRSPGVPTATPSGEGDKAKRGEGDKRP